MKTMLGAVAVISAVCAIYAYIYLASWDCILFLAFAVVFMMGHEVWDNENNQG